MKRKSFEAQSVITWMHKNETYAEAKARLDAEWKAGTHPAQFQRTKRERKQGVK